MTTTNIERTPLKAPITLAQSADGSLSTGVLVVTTRAGVLASVLVVTLKNSVAHHTCNQVVQIHH